MVQTNMHFHLVVDDFREGVPVAWLISNHEDGKFISKFFSALKERTGNLEPEWFTTDDAPQYFYFAECVW